MRSIETYILDTDIFNDERLYELLLTKMPAYRQQKVRSFIFVKDRRLALAAGVLLAYGLQDLGMSGHRDVLFGENGKPYLADSLHFNISHSGSKAVCSFSDHDVGVDIEQILPVGDALIEHVSVASEQAYLFELEPEEKRHAFFDLWTAKESYMKWRGTGLMLPPNQLELHRGDPLRISEAGQPTKVQFKQYRLPGYCLTVCSETANFADSITSVDNPDALAAIFSNS